MGIKNVTPDERSALEKIIESAHNLLRTNELQKAHLAFEDIIAKNKSFLKIVHNNKEPPKKPFLTGLMKSAYLGCAFTYIELHASNPSPNLLAQAEKYLNLIPSEQKNNTRVHLAWGRYHQAKLAYEEAFAAFETSIATANNDSTTLADIYFSRAYCYQQRKQFDAAYTDYEIAYKYKKNPLVLLSHAICLEEAKETEQALLKLKEALVKYPNHPELRLGYARVLQHLRRYDEALNIFKQLPTEKKYQLAIAFCLRDASRHADALTKLKTINDSKNLSYLVLKGECLIKVGQLDEGIRLFEAAIKLNPNNATPIINYALALEAIEETESASKLYEQHYERFKADTEFVLSYARFLETCDQFGLASKVIKQLPPEQQQNLNVVVTLTTTLAKNGQADEALQTLNTTPETKVTRLRKAFLFQNSQRLEEALTLFDNLVIEFDKEQNNKSEVYKLALFGRARCL